MKIETGWLLEKESSPAKYLKINNGFYEWTLDPNEALRLARKEDADALATIIEDAERVCEHGWYDE